MFAEGIASRSENAARRGLTGLQKAGVSTERWRHKKGGAWMKCSRCDSEISEDRSYVHQGRVFCEDCLMEVGLHAGKCEPWASYLAGKERKGLTGTEGLTDMQQIVYDFIKNRGKVTREEVKSQLNLSEAEMDAQLTPLMFSELVKEKGEGGNLYLVTVG